MPQWREEVERPRDLAADGQQARVVAGHRDELGVVRVLGCYSAVS